jgi:glyoxylase-like metal-dependent hydrolase (beta-lactamase superfamily II)
MGLIREQLAVGPLQCNCSILADPQTREAIVIDPGEDADRIVQRLRQRDLRVRYLLHTHAHLDHVGATAAVKQATEGRVCLHQRDSFLYDDVAGQARMVGLPAPQQPPPVDHWLAGGEVIDVAGFGLDVLHTPGHTPGSCCFLLRHGDGPAVLFAGDTLFLMSIGRTDLPGGDSEQIFASIQRELLCLDETTKVVPGHGPGTTIGFEKRANPFLQAL